jgi:hypothetical protein
MQAFNLFSVECPRCRAAIPFLRVKPRFACKACAAPLMSNRSSVDVWAVLIYVVLLPGIWIVSDDFSQTANWSSALRIGLSCVFAAAFYCLLAPRALRLEPDTSSSGEPASRAAKKT